MPEKRSRERESLRAGSDQRVFKKCDMTERDVLMVTSTDGVSSRGH